MTTHGRTISDKQPNRSRRPSLPSIFEGLQHTNLPFVSMAPSANSNNNTPEVPTLRRSLSSSMHRPSVEEIRTHSCPATPRTSLDQHFQNKRSRTSSLSMTAYFLSPQSSSDESSCMILSSSPSAIIYTPAGTTDWFTAVTSDGHPDWYGYGVVSSYGDKNYLLLLELRAYNLGCNENGDLERHSQEMTRRFHDTYKFSTTTEDGSNIHQDNISAKKHCSSSVDSSVNGHRLLRTIALLKNVMAARSTVVSSLSANESISPSDDHDDEEEEEEEEKEDEESKSLPCPSVVLDYRPEADTIRYNSTDQPEVKKVDLILNLVKK